MSHLETPAPARDCLPQPADQPERFRTRVAGKLRGLPRDNGFESRLDHRPPEPRLLQRARGAQRVHARAHAAHGAAQVMQPQRLEQD